MSIGRTDLLLDDVGAPAAPGAILIVDDHRESRAALEAVLEPLGERVIDVDSGDAALRALLHHDVAVILLDVRMAGLDGVQTARLIRSRPATRHIPIIFLTAVASDATQIELAYATGAVDYVVKPFEPSILRAKVSAFVALSRERTERLRQSRARARAEAAARAVRTLQSLSDAALAHLELEPLANELLDRACTLFDAAGGLLLLREPDANSLRVVAARELSPSDDALATSDAVSDLLALQDAIVLGPHEPAWETLTGEPAGEAAVVPLHDPDALTTRGLLVLAAERPGSFDDADLALLQLAGDRISIAVDHAQRFEYQREVVETLQRSLLPERLPEHPQLDFAARYRPAETGARIGGDWYDAIALDERRIALMIGDVVGHGIRAAARMGELRNALRAYATDGHAPGPALHRLERLVRSTGETGMVATVLFGVLDLHTRSITLARAGHPPPLVRATDGAVRVLDSGSTLPLGVIGTTVPTEFTYALADGETLLLFTDGLVERRSEPIDAGIDRLMTAFGDGTGAAGCSCDRVLERLLGNDSIGDDVAVIAVHVRPPDGPLRLDLPARRESVPAARHHLREWLARRLPQLDRTLAGDVEVALSEACTNVVRHAYGPRDARFRMSATLTGGTLEVTVEDDGSWRLPRQAHGGHGIQLIHALCDDVTIERGETGTTVTMRWHNLA